MAYALQATDIYKTYSRGPVAVKAVRGVSVAISSGEMVAIVGPSGSGKSTLLHLLATLDRPDSGEIWIGGRKLSELDDSGRTQLRRHQIGLVFQFFNLMPLLSARENIALPLLLGGMHPTQADERADELLARVGLAGRSQHKADALSGGEMQRVAVARALGPRPVLLLADEPTGNLDSVASASVLALLKATTQDSGCAVVMITHDARAASVADRVLEFKDGKIVGG
jgi:putative ABC transport system ATP-binding protein